MSQKATPSFNLLIGIGQLLRGQERGFFNFGRSPIAFLFSLAPLVSLLPVETMISAQQEGPHRAMTSLLAGFCMLLLPAVVTQAVAQYWRREELWLRYAIAFNWCRWALFLALAVIILIVTQAVGAHSADNAAVITIGLFGLYDLWLQWFLARRGMLLSRSVATLTVAVVNLSAIGLAVIAYQFGKV